MQSSYEDWETTVIATQVDHIKKAQQEDEMLLFKGLKQPKKLHSYKDIAGDESRNVKWRIYSQ